jgi:hypothetical protein
VTNCKTKGLSSLDFFSRICDKIDLVNFFHSSLGVLRFIFFV